MFNQMYSLLIAENGSGGIPWWVWVILIVILLVLLWFWFGREKEEAEEAGTRAAEIPQVLVEAAAPAAPAAPDDLKKIEGIGPKVARLLNEAGITTFQQMVDAGAERLESILDAAGLQMLDAGTWPDQARLAAAGDWEALAKLQDQLKGGKIAR